MSSSDVEPCELPSFVHGQLVKSCHLQQYMSRRGIVLANSSSDVMLDSQQGCISTVLYADWYSSCSPFIVRLSISRPTIRKKNVLQFGTLCSRVVCSFLGSTTFWRHAGVEKRVQNKDYLNMKMFSLSLSLSLSLPLSFSLSLGITRRRAAAANLK